MPLACGLHAQLYRHHATRNAPPLVVLPGRALQCGHIHLTTAAVFKVCERSMMQGGCGTRKPQGHSALGIGTPWFRNLARRPCCWPLLSDITQCSPLAHTFHFQATRRTRLARYLTYHVGLACTHVLPIEHLAALAGVELHVVVVVSQNPNKFY